MTEPADFKEARRRRRRKVMLRRTKKLLIVLAVLALLGLIIFAGYRLNWGSHFGNLFHTSARGEGFPIPMAEGEFTSLADMKGDVAVTESGSVTVYHSRGEVLGCFPNSYTRPYSIARGGKILTYDLGGSGWQITSKTKVLHNENAAGVILAAALGDKGEVAVARRHASALSEVKVYSPRFEVMYIWESAESYTTALSVSENGTSLATGGVLSKGGALSSVIIFHDMTGERDRVSHTLPDSVILSMTFTRKGRLQVITDRALLLYDEKGALLQEIPLAEPPVAVENCPGGGVYIALGDYRSKSGVAITAYDSDFNEAGKTFVNRRVLSLHYTDERLYILAEGKLLLGDPALTEVKDRGRGALQQIAPYKNTYYGVTNEGLIREKL